MTIEAIKMKYIGSNQDQINFAPYGNDPNEYMEVGDILTLSGKEVHSWHTLLSFEEIPTAKFNSVMFEEV
jgi:hypothetical protein